MTNYNHIHGIIYHATCTADVRHNRRMVRDCDLKNARPSHTHHGSWYDKTQVANILRNTHHSGNLLHYTINVRSGLYCYNPDRANHRKIGVCQWLPTRHARRRLGYPRPPAIHSRNLSNHKPLPYRGPLPSVARGHFTWS